MIPNSPRSTTRRWRFFVAPGCASVSTKRSSFLRAAGCQISDGDLVKIPATVVEEALGSAPSSISLYGRDGEPRICLEGSRTFFGTGSDLPNILDLETGERRLSRLSDVADTARLADSLPNIDFVMSMALPSDVAPETSDRRSFLAMIENTIQAGGLHRLGRDRVGRHHRHGGGGCRRH